MINQQWSKRDKRFYWGYNARVPTENGIRRRRVYEFETQDEAESALRFLQNKSPRYGMGGLPVGPLMSDLIAKRLASLTIQNEIGRETRVLIEWLSLLDPSVDGKERNVEKVSSKILVTDIDAPKVQKWAERRKSQVSPSSVRRELVIIAATLHQASEFFPELDQWNPPKVRYPKIPKPRRERIISQEEYFQILSYLMRDKAFDEWPWQYQARIRVGQIFQFAMTTAMRHGEIAGLKWSDIDWDSDPAKLIVFQIKTGKYKHIPITSVAREILKQRKGESKNQYVFCDSENPDDGGNVDSDFYEIFSRACEACNIPYGKNTPNGLILHDARHTVTTRLADSGLNFDTIRLITGHSDKTLVMHYTHYHNESVRQAAEVLEKTSRRKK